MMMNKNILFWFLGTVALLVAGGLGYLYFKESSQTYPVGKTPAVVLAEQNQSYAAAQKLQEEGKYGQALQGYQEALSEAKDDFQKAQILFNIAHENEQLGKYKEAIIQFKAITADPSYYPIARAAALQNVGLMYYTYSGSTTLQTIVSETFKDSPYNSFRNTGGTLSMAYIKLFEYAASLYPLAGSEVRIAYGYSNELLNALHGATTTPQGKAYLALIMQGLEATKIDLARMENVAEERSLIPEILVRAGSTVDNLITLGVIHDPQQAEPYFKDGVEYAAKIGSKPGSFHAFNYASFLTNRYGETRAEDIKKLLMPFRLGNEKEIYPTVASYLHVAHADKPTTKRWQRIVALGKMDSDFKNYLFGLGWQVSDFK